jgi:F0F1-type ATP synthase assembly protein I
MSIIKKKKDKGQSSVSAMRYLGLASQLFISIGVGLWLGWKLDGFFSFQSPWLIWILPLVIVVSSLIKIIIDTNKRNK